MTYLADRTINTVTQFTGNWTSGELTQVNNLYYGILSVDDCQGNTLIADASGTKKNFTIDGAVVVGTPVADVADWTDYDVYVVYSKNDNGNREVSQLYIIDKGLGGNAGTQGPAAPLSWTVEGNYEYAISSGSAPNYVGYIYTASNFETLTDAATQFTGTMYVTAPGGLRHTANATELATSINSMLAAGYAVEMTNANGTWTFVASK